MLENVINLALLLLPWQFCASVIKCPEICVCDFDIEERQTVTCAGGGMSKMPLHEIYVKTQVIKISAPEDRLNSLTMDPNLQEFAELQELHITRSNIPELGVQLLWSLKKLKVLNLSQNNITQPLHESFRGLQSLKELYLDDNRIFNLPSGTFRYLKSLLLLSLQRNRLTEMTPRMFEQVGKLQVLRLSGNHLSKLNPDSFKGVLQDLRTLECRGCSLSKIDAEVYQYLPHLTNLDLGYNEIHDIATEDFSNLSMVKSIKLDGNKLWELTENVFFYTRMLRKLNLARNSLSKIHPSAFSHLKSITDLDLSYNKLEYLEIATFLPVNTTLQHLSMSGNFLNTQVLQSVLKGVPNLSELEIADGGLNDVPENTFPGEITCLNLAGNILTSMTPNSLPPKLFELDISRNQFANLKIDLLEQLDTIVKVSLDKNPWMCDLCHISPVLEQINQSKTLREIRCHGPHGLEGRSLNSLDIIELSWCTSPNYIGDIGGFFIGNSGKIGVIAASGSVLLLFIICVAIMVTLCYSRRYRADYYTHEEKRISENDNVFDDEASFFDSKNELSFKFPIDFRDSKISIAIIDSELKKDST